MTHPTILDLGTPVPLIDRDRLQANLARAARQARAANAAIRPHVKTHKCTALASLQIAHGAIGLTTATLAEAEALQAAGFFDLLIARTVANPNDRPRLARLARPGGLICAVDHPDHLGLLAAAAHDAGTRIAVRIEIDSGHHRCGVANPGDALTLARMVVATPNLTLDGVFTHAGHAYGAASRDQLAAIAGDEAGSALAAARAIRAAGIRCEQVSIGSTPSLAASVRAEGITEIRPGNSVFFDAIQVALGVVPVESCALTVLSTVIGVYSGRFVIDAGSKAIGLDKGAHGIETAKGYGIFPEHPDWTLARLSEEHGIVEVGLGSPSPRIGDRVRFIPNHACATVNLHSELIVVEETTVLERWPVTGRRQEVIR